MKIRFLPSRGIFSAAAALALAALTAAPCAAQTACATGAVPANGTCAIGAYAARFASATGSISASTQGITLSGGWVLMTPLATVTTTYAPGGVGALPTFLVVAYGGYTTVAVVSGTLASAGNLQAGCQVRYLSTSNGSPVQLGAISADTRGTVPILSGLGVSYPGSCPQ